MLERARADALAERGLGLLASCDSECDVEARVAAGGSTAGVSAARLPAGEQVLLRVALPGGAESLLGGRQARALTVRVAVRGVAGGRRTLSRRVVAVRGPEAVPVPVGISDQQPSTFGDPRFRLLGVRHVRYVAAWDAVWRDRARLPAWMDAAERAGAEVHVALGRSAHSRCPASPCRLPSARAYRRALRALLRRYPQVRTLTPWNEANHRSQPTASAPGRAARYYAIARQECRGCRVVAADVLDSKNLAPWLAEFRRHAPGRPRLWGLHNYADANRFRSAGIEAMLRLVPGQVWLTETGGIVSFTTEDGRNTFPANEGRAARALRHLFELTASHAGRLSRVYLYQWRITNPGDRFDAGLVRPDGRPRPGLWALTEALP